VWGDLPVTEEEYREWIIREPENDSARLIYADWLDEQRNPRGEFIRVQIALSRLASDDPRRKELESIEQSLLGKYEKIWAQPLKGIVSGVEFRRGFVETVILDARQFVRRAQELFRLEPILGLRLLECADWIEEVAQCQELECIREVTIFAQHLGATITSSLGNSTHLPKLNKLSLVRNNLGPAGAEALARSSIRIQLRDLDLSENWIGDDGIRALGQPDALPQLENLTLIHDEISPVLGTLLAARIPSLIRLDLSSNPIRQQSIPIPRDVVTNPSLRQIRLLGCKLSPNQLMRLGERLEVPNLEQIDLANNEFGSAGVEALLATPWLSQLKRLNLADNRIGDTGCRAIANSPQLGNLERLDLSHNPVHDAGATVLINSPNLRNLKRLGISPLGLSPKVKTQLIQRYQLGPMR
jgi:uncharacterized protein (TIGR02996 family)